MKAVRTKQSKTFGVGSKMKLTSSTSLTLQADSVAKEGALNFQNLTKERARSWCLQIKENCLLCTPRGRWTHES